MRIVVIGGVAGGMSAATRLRRLNEKAEIIAPISGYKTPAQLEMYLKFFGENYNGEVSQGDWETYRDNFKPTFQ